MLTEKLEKRGFWGQGQGLAWDKLLVPIAPLVASLMRSLRVFRRCTPVGEDEGKSKNIGGLPGGKVYTGSFVLRGLKPGCLGEILGKDFSRMFINFSRCILSGS